ncbi:MAG: hypothetical protein H6733_10850 [Alphaproteobacteria bacterium]|nr:hypothetical protein [Alphaproteobacteria bacterium]
MARRAGWVLLLGACTTGTPDGELCPSEGDGKVRAGDANGDGVVDIADALVVYRAVADGGPAPVCLLASDLVPEGRLNYDDAHSLLLHLYEDGFTLPDVRPADCADADPLAPPTCVAAEVTFAVDGTDILVSLNPGSTAVEAWSLGVHATGCTIATATTDGTQAAWQADGGRRDIGYDATFVTADGTAALSTVVLDFADATALLPDAGPQPILALTITPGPGDCTLTVTDDEKAERTWPKVRSAAAIATASFPLAGPTVTFTP